MLIYVFGFVYIFMCCYVIVKNKLSPSLGDLLLIILGLFICLFSGVVVDQQQALIKKQTKVFNIK